MPSNQTTVRIRRALFTVSDKAGIAELARALERSGTEIVATGRTAGVLQEAGIRVTPIEKVSGSPEAFRGRMKTLSFPVCSGILYRRADEADEADLRKLAIQPIDCVVVNFYPFETTAARAGISRAELIEEIDIGGPTLVRAAAKNAPAVLVLTSPAQYARVIEDVKNGGGFTEETATLCAAEAWTRIRDYDQAIAEKFGAAGSRLSLRYGENPHQQGELEFSPDSPIDWGTRLTATELSYNNILDLTAAYTLAGDLREIAPQASGVVIVKHNNPCGVALVPRTLPRAQLAALERAWEGDPVSAFGGVLVFTDPIAPETAEWLASRFVELVAAPGLSPSSTELATLVKKRKNLKAVPILRFGEAPRATAVNVPGGVLRQSADLALDESPRCVTQRAWPAGSEALSRFGIAVCRTLKSNALAIVRRLADGTLQVVGTGQGQPNRVEALRQLAIPRAEAVLQATGGRIEECILVSDAFFPFRDTIDVAAAAGIRAIIQPGGSIKDAESIAACDEQEVAMAFTGVRHFRH